MNNIKKIDNKLHFFLKVRMTSLINIDNYNEKFKEYHEDIIEFSKKNNLTLISLTSMRRSSISFNVSTRNKRVQTYW